LPIEIVALMRALTHSLKLWDLYWWWLL